MSADRATTVENDGFGLFTPASVDPRIARLVARDDGQARVMRFTPAGATGQATRSVTVAVRIDDSAARSLSVNSAVDAAHDAAGLALLRIAPNRYNLGLSRGYQNFAKPAVAAAPALSRSLSDAAIPDLATFRPAPGVAEKPSRFAASIADEGTSRPAAAAPRAGELQEQSVDVAGSYRLTRNLDVTAGVRYSQERDRLAPLADTAKQDNQAVYVGTQFRF